MAGYTDNDLTHQVARRLAALDGLDPDEMINQPSSSLRPRGCGTDQNGGLSSSLAGATRLCIPANLLLSGYAVAIYLSFRAVLIRRKGPRAPQARFDWLTGKIS
jgi:hypothetical protein